MKFRIFFMALVALLISAPAHAYEVFGKATFVIEGYQGYTTTLDENLLIQNRRHTHQSRSRRLFSNLNTVVGVGISRRPHPI